MNVLKTLLLFCFGLCLSAAALADPAMRQARAHEQVWFDLYNKGDAAGVSKLYATDAILTPPGVAALHGQAAIRAYLVTDIATSKKQRLTLKLGEISGAHEAGDTMWISGSWMAVDAQGKTVDSGNYVEVSRRMKSGWSIVRDIWNSDHAPAAPASD